MKYFEHLNKIKESYKDWSPRSDPYRYYDWSKIFTPIEENVWHDIRVLGLPFYPQFPIKRYFVDFADPLKKIALEVDGKKYHQDKSKDKKREQEIKNIGWRVIRFPGKITFKEYQDYFPEDFEEKLIENYEYKEDRQIQRNYYWKEYTTKYSEGILLKLKKEYYENI